MAKKSFFEKLGLVESDEPVGTPEFESELRVCSGVGDHYINGDFPEDEQVQAEVPEGDTIDIETVYNANNMNPADSVTVYKIKDVIENEMRFVRLIYIILLSSNILVFGAIFFVVYLNNKQHLALSQKMMTEMPT